MFCGEVGWNWEVLHFGFRAHTIFFGGVGWGGIEKVLQFGITRFFFFCGVVDMMVSYHKIPVISPLLIYPPPPPRNEKYICL